MPMRVIERERLRPLDPSDYKERQAQEGDYEELITEPCIVVIDGEVRIVYLDLDEEGMDPRPMLWALRRIKYRTAPRTGGLMSTSRTFGFAPRNTLRSDFCSSAKLAEESPKEHAIICSYAEKVDRLYREYGPDKYEDHKEKVEEVLADYRLEESVFTSGIINKNNPLNYHHDSGNFREVWSNMLVFKHQIQGGHLSCPELGLGFELKNNSCFMFDGQGILHGVTPIRKLSPDAVRFSVVFYSLRQMWNCDDVDDELMRIRKVKTERERKRSEREQAEG